MQNQNISLQTYPVRLRKRGQLTIPEPIRTRLNLHKGDCLVLVNFKHLVLILPEQSQNQPLLAEAAV